MRDIDREIGLERSSDGAQAVVARLLGERLLYVDEIEDTIEVLRARGAGDTEHVRDLERELEAERTALESLERRDRIDYARIDRVMVDRDREV